MRIIAAWPALAVVCATVLAAEPNALVDDRRRVEDVYWHYTIWPESNTSPKPPLAEVLPAEAIAAKVGRALQKEEALRERWGRTISSREIQREMDRMAAGCRKPEMLNDLFQALDRDPARIAETIVKPVLVDRLLRPMFASDARIHDAARKKAEQALRDGRVPWTRVEWTAADLTPENHDGVVASLAQGFHVEARYDALPVSRVSDLVESEGAFTVTTIDDKRAGGLSVRTARWPKVSLESWLDATYPAASAPVVEIDPATPLVTPSIPESSCTDDTWRTLAISSIPGARQRHLAVWTGSSMLIFGGEGTLTPMGARYDPATDTWHAINPGGPPLPRGTAVWTGQVMVVWGGPPYSGIGISNTGGRYDPLADTWTTTSTVGAPGSRFYHSAVWTGSRMLVWGGYSNNAKTALFDGGGSYDPVNDTWTALPESQAGAPGGHAGHGAVWTGTDMIVWGGVTSTWRGARYNLASNTWSQVTDINAPAARTEFTATWTGSRMIVYGGEPGFLADGARYDPVSDTWQPMTSVNAPPGRSRHTAVWTGSRLVVWAGFTSTSLQSGGIYDPAGDTWQAMPTTGAPPQAQWHSAVWTGTEMLIWGGNASQGMLDFGGRFDPIAGTWAPLAYSAAPVRRFGSASVWTGSRGIVWGGWDGSGLTQTGAIYDPATDTWSPTTTSGSPSARDQAPGVWTGTRMLVWGGRTSSGQPSDGAAYDPSADSWTPITTVGAPAGRVDFTSVWTGNRMVVWGGRNGSTASGDGGRYDPVTNVWQPVTSAGAPSARSGHVSVWTGNRMLVWGGGAGVVGFNTGGRYDPVADAWSPMTTTTAPLARGEESVVWTGRFMAVWGGNAGGVLQNTGGYYDPATDTWFIMSTIGAPTPRRLHRAVFAENQMLTWGGSNVIDGGRWDPNSNSWTPITATGAPSSRTDFQMWWTGERMVVATGQPFSNDTRDYCFVCTPTTWYRDADGDGAGDATHPTSACAAVGYVANTDDCDDTDPNRHLGAPEICDGKDDDCDGNTPANEVDGDLDGVRICANDCNDANPAVHAGAPEICNGIDDNCSGTTDEDALGEDTDADTVHNACDNCPTVPNTTQTDTDADLVGNACDNCPAIKNANQADADGDTLGDLCDNCRFAPNVSQTDTDLDRVGDACDNCLSDYNPGQLDMNLDGEGDLCDLNDGLIYVFGTDDKNYIEWQAETGPSSWNAYEGDLAVLKSTGVYTQAPGSNPLADRQCGLADTFVQDLVIPAAGKVRFSLVTGVTGGVEGSLGTNSAGVPRPNANPCP